MQTIEKFVAVRVRGFVCLSVLFLLATMTCRAQMKDQQMPTHAKIEVTTVSVRPEMAEDFENLIKTEYNPGITKGGAKWSDVWRSAVFGNAFEYVFVGPIDNFAQFDGASPLMKGLGKEGATAFFAQAGKMITGVRSVASEVRDDLSYNTKMTAPPKMAVVNFISVAPGRTAEYENFIKNDLLPVVQKSGVAGYWVNKTMFGGDLNEYVTLTLEENFADIDKGAPSTRVLGQEGAMKLFQKLPAGVVAHQERIVSRYVPELSYRPAMTANK